MNISFDKYENITAKDISEIINIANFSILDVYVKSDEKITEIADWINPSLRKLFNGLIPRLEHDLDKYNIEDERI